MHSQTCRPNGLRLLKMHRGCTSSVKKPGFKFWMGTEYVFIDAQVQQVDPFSTSMLDFPGYSSVELQSIKMCLLFSIQEQLHFRCPSFACTNVLGMTFTEISILFLLLIHFAANTCLPVHQISGCGGLWHMTGNSQTRRSVIFSLNFTNKW